MRINLPSRVRAGLYIFTALGTPVVGYLLDKGIIGTTEAALWAAEVSVVTVMAALNVTSSESK